MKARTLEFDRPEISDELLTELLQKIRPVIVREDGRYYYIEVPDPRSVSFLWDPVPTEAAQDIEPFASIPTLHTWGYYGLFKPTIAEVLTLLPMSAMDRTIAFSVDGPRHANDLNAQLSVVNGGHHLAVTTLYQRCS